VRFVDADLRFPRGPAGPHGAVGPAGPPGARGPAGPVGRAPLAVALSVPRLSARRGARLALRYAATDGAAVIVRILRGTRMVKRVNGRARSGANLLRLRAPGKAGRYRLQLTASAADGRTATARAQLIVRAPRRR
jgi:hypothetical protein